MARSFAGTRNWMCPAENRHHPESYKYLKSLAHPTQLECVILPWEGNGRVTPWITRSEL
jgi:hypothetical protein